MRRVFIVFGMISVFLMAAEPVQAAFGLPSGGFFSWLGPIIQSIGLGLLWLIYQIPGGEDLMIGIF